MTGKKELHFTRTNGPVDDAIDQLIALAGPVCCSDLVREMVLTALKAGLEEANEADLKLMNSTLKEMRFTSKIFGPYRNITQGHSLWFCPDTPRRAGLSDGAVVGP